MKMFHKLHFIAILILLTGLTFTLGKITDQRAGQVQAQNQPRQDLPIPIALPALADIYLKGGESKTGRVTTIDLRK